MKWAEFNKEQKQKIVLAVLLGVIALFAGIQFGIKPYLASRARAHEEYELLKMKVEQAGEVLKNENSLIEQLSQASGQVSRAANELLPAPENPLSWARKLIAGCARSAGVSYEAIGESDVDVSPWIDRSQVRRQFKPYAIRVTLECSYDQLRRFIQALEEADPFVNVASLAISAVEQSPTRHQVVLTVEWPSWKDAEKGKPYRTKEGSGA